MPLDFSKVNIQRDNAAISENCSTAASQRQLQRLNHRTGEGQESIEAGVKNGVHFLPGLRWADHEQMDDGFPVGCNFSGDHDGRAVVVPPRR